MAQRDKVKIIMNWLSRKWFFAILLVSLPAILFFLNFYSATKEVVLPKNVEIKADTGKVEKNETRIVQIDSSNVGTVIMGDQNNHEK